MVPLALPLLQLLARLRTVPHADATALRDRTAAALQSFQDRALAAGHSAGVVRRAHYVLCLCLDEAVLRTPWGATTLWRHDGMMARFYPALDPGRLDDVLRQVEAKPGPMRAALEVIALCLSLGVTGSEDRRQAALAALTAERPPPASLAVTWQGVAAPFRRNRVRVPLWAAAAATLAAAGAAFFYFEAHVNDRGDAAFARMLAAPPATMPRLEREAAPPVPPAPPLPAEPTAADRLRTRLAASTDVAVAGTAAVPVLRVADAALFARDARLLPSAGPLLASLAAALRPEGGQLRVLGYLDDRPVRGVPFGSAFKLSAARADTVRAELARLLGPGTTITAEGRADADPVADNGTPEGRARNRRVEILLEGAPP